MGTAKKLDPVQLHVARSVINAEIVGLPKLSLDRRDVYQAAEKAMLKRLEEKFGARIDRRYDGTRVRLYGVSAHSTTGPIGALRNWMAGAGRTLDKQSWLAR
jgi:hypothetical protein